MPIYFSNHVTARVNQFILEAWNFGILEKNKPYSTLKVKTLPAGFMK